MSTTNRSTRPPPPPSLFTTGNEGLANEIETLKSIYRGEYDGAEVEKQLLRVAHNLGRLMCLQHKHAR